jgi:D-alanine--poly(phosphoribitol) ligase subunit 1
MLERPEWLYVPGQTDRRGNRVPLSALLKYGADHHPTRTAITDGQTSYTFLELERGAQRIATTLREIGVRRGDRVAVLAEKLALLPMLAAAIWKLGAVYVPLDSDSPPMRLQHMLEQLAPAAVLGKAERLAACQLTLPRITFESLANTANVETARTQDAECEVEEDEVAYIIFTSGSTGAPKGVMISHKSLLDYFFNHNQVLRFTPDSRVFSFSPFHFDVSIEDTLLPLSVGAFVYQFRGAPVGALVYRLLTRERITHLIAVSTLLAMITPAVSTELPDLEMVMTGAEVCDPKIINHWKRRMPYLRVRYRDLIHEKSHPPAALPRPWQSHNALESCQRVGRACP